MIIVIMIMKFSFYEELKSKRLSQAARLHIEHCDTVLPHTPSKFWLVGRHLSIGLTNCRLLP